VENLPAAQAVEQLISQYSKLVFHTIYGMTGDWEESQDLTQDTFHQALKSLDAARSRSGEQFNAKAWLLQIAVNTVRMKQRRDRLFRLIPFSRLEKEQRAPDKIERRAPTELVEEQAAPIQPAGYSTPRSEDPADLLIERDTVQRVLRQISPPLRECLLLSIVGQFSASEIAAVLGIEEAAVRQRIARARKQFQAVYRQLSGDEVIDHSPDSETSAKSMSQNPSTMHLSHKERAEGHFSRLLP
jgi:RNA polymerase sigma factor (sigma-70 family)